MFSEYTCLKLKIFFKINCGRVHDWKIKTERNISFDPKSFAFWGTNCNDKCITLTNHYLDISKQVMKNGLYTVTFNAKCSRLTKKNLRNRPQKLDFMEESIGLLFN